MKFILSTIIVLLLGQTTFGQADSLRLLTKNNSLHDTIRYKAYYDLAWHFMYSDRDSAKFYAEILINEAQEGHHDQWVSNGFSALGVSYLVYGMYEDAISPLTENLKINTTLGNKKFMASSYANLGICYKNMSQFGKALDLSQKSLKLKEELKDTLGQARTYASIGTLYRAMGDNRKALDIFLLADSTFILLGDQKSHGLTLINLGLIYDDLGQVNKALECYENCEKIYLEINYQQGLANLYSNRGNLYRDMGRYREGIAEAKKALQIRQALNDIGGLLASYMNLGALYNHDQQHQKAREHCEKALQLAEENHNIEGIFSCHDCLYKAYKEMGSTQKALYHYETSKSWEDSLINEDKQREVIRLETQYSFEKQAILDSLNYVKELAVKDVELEALAANERASEAEKSQLKAESKRNNVIKIALIVGLLFVVAFALFAYRRFQLTRAQNVIIEKQKEEVEVQRQAAVFQKELVEEKNKEILDSINYAKRIQTAILPPDKLVKQYLEDSFILYKPKDIVAGDFYWCEPIKNGVLFAAADCTGHGVPGAMVSVICNNGLNRAVREYDLTMPGQILDKTREIVIAEFEKSEEEVKDGMDIALCALENKVLHYSGANNPLWIVRNGASEIEEIKADKQPIGKYANPQPYTTHAIELNEGDSFYIFSDGYADQFGGVKGKKFKAASFKKLLLSIQNVSIEQQRQLIDEAFEKWKGDLEQLDDVCVIGVRMSQ